MLETIKDVKPNDWVSALHGMSWAEYTKPIRLAYEHGAQERNDILRPDFNERARRGEKLYEYGVISFYKDWLGLFARNRAYEMSETGCFEKAFEHGRALCKQNAEYAYTLDWLKSRKSPTVLDHGCGLGHTTLALLEQPDTHVVMHDWAIPSLRLMRDLAERNFGQRVVLTSPMGTHDCGGAASFEYDAIITQDVLEHVINPREQLAQIVDKLKPGGKLLMGTFFNSCEGKDPQHLEEHNRYQDTSLWFSEVEALGLRLCFKDPNGVEKVWIKET